MTAVFRRSRPLAAALLLLTALTACDDGTGPAGPFDARATADVMASMVAAGDGLGDAFGSMEAAGNLFGSAAAAMLVAGGPNLDARAVRDLVEGPRPEAFFPSNFLGVTFEYSDAEGSYVPTDMVGAPANGIRILYYAVDPFTRVPQTDMPLGYIDLGDESTAAADRLTVEVVNTAGGAAVTLASYAIEVAYTLADTQVGAVVESVGYLSNGEDRLDFDLGMTITLSETTLEFGQDYTMALAGTDLAVHYVADLSGSPDLVDAGTLDLTATITGEGQSAVIELTASGGEVDGTIAHGGDVVAYIGGSAAQPTFTDAEGNPLDAAELEALQDVFDAVGRLLELADGIFSPAQ